MSGDWLVGLPPSRVATLNKTLLELRDSSFGVRVTSAQLFLRENAPALVFELQQTQQEATNRVILNWWDETFQLVRSIAHSVLQPSSNSYVDMALFRATSSLRGVLPYGVRETIHGFHNPTEQEVNNLANWMISRDEAFVMLRVETYLDFCHLMVDLTLYSPSFDDPEEYDESVAAVLKAQVEKLKFAVRSFYLFLDHEVYVNTAHNIFAAENPGEQNPFRVLNGPGEDAVWPYFD